jgi:hypothetical protein
MAWYVKNGGTLAAEWDTNADGTFQNKPVADGIYQVYVGLASDGSPYPDSPACPFEFQVTGVHTTLVFRRGHCKGNCT